MKLGFIGSGKMATALVKGVVKSGLAPATDISVSDALPAAAQALAEGTGASALASNSDVVNVSDAIVLAVKPHDAIAAIRSLAAEQTDSPMRWAWSGGDEKTGKLLISIVAGLTIASLEQAASGRFRIVRVMPNTPAILLEGASAFALGSRATDADAGTVQNIFGSVGLAVQVKEELLDAVTGLSGSGPAFVCTIIEALADGGVLMGLPRALALQLAAKTVAGSAAMVLGSGRHPAVLRDEVASPGGTTIAGLEALEAGGLRSALISAVRAAAERARQLGGPK